MCPSPHADTNERGVVCAVADGILAFVVRSDKDKDRKVPPPPPHTHTLCVRRARGWRWSVSSVYSTLLHPYKPSHARLGRWGKAGKAGEPGPTRGRHAPRYHRERAGRGRQPGQPIVRLTGYKGWSARTWVWKVTGDAWSCKSHGTTIGFPPGRGELVLGSGRFPICPRWSDIPGWIVPAEPRRLRLPHGESNATGRASCLTTLARPDPRPSGPTNPKVGANLHYRLQQGPWRDERPLSGPPPRNGPKDRLLLSLPRRYLPLRKRIGSRTRSCLLLALGTRSQAQSTQTWVRGKSQKPSQTRGRAVNFLGNVVNTPHNNPTPPSPLPALTLLCVRRAW